MADVQQGSRELHVAELELQIAQQELNIKSANVRRMQIKTEMDKIDKNIDASVKQINLLQNKLSEIING